MQPSPATQFANLAEAYSKSKGHANPEVLAMLVELIEPRLDARLLDVATGPGHVALAFAPHVASVVAQDLTPSMLEFVEAESVRRGLTNVTTLLGSAESLSAADQSFDIVTTRLGAHHFPDVPAALREFFRVLRPGGRLLVLEFSRVWGPLEKLYDLYSFQVLPRMGARIAGDADSYRYLAESIRMHPDQAELKTMMQTAGFGHVDVHNLTAGVVALHAGIKC
jgi:demethylmenaquinone methyltransferase/2-methoxy-6-polyprenyl-1,4-benzoquinol methylase